jgi:hypothetical protein
MFTHIWLRLNPPTTITTTLSTALATPRKRIFFDLWPLCSTRTTLLAVWDSPFTFFFWFDEISRQRLNIDT